MKEIPELSEPASKPERLVPETHKVDEQVGSIPVDTDELVRAGLMFSASSGRGIDRDEAYRTLEKWGIRR